MTTKKVIKKVNKYWTFATLTPVQYKRFKEDQMFIRLYGEDWFLEDKYDEYL